MYLVPLKLRDTGRDWAQRLRVEDAGQTMVEYALIAFLIVIGLVSLLMVVAFDLQEFFDAVEEFLGAGSDNDAVTLPRDDDAEPSP